MLTDRHTYKPEIAHREKNIKTIIFRSTFYMKHAVLVTVLSIYRVPTCGVVRRTLRESAKFIRRRANRKQTAQGMRETHITFLLK